MVGFGKTIYLKYGNLLRSVPVERVLPDLNEEKNMEDSYLEPEDVPKSFKDEIPGIDHEKDFIL